MVIGETAIVGKRVRIYQAVTTGAKRFPRGEDGQLQKNYPRHPIIEDDVVIYAGADNPRENYHWGALQHRRKYLANP
ncbi:hypothetical protein LNP17_20490 [Klebsiella variicola subsp. variicola]|nr:hypothetical protein [Klebsiella variicola subsp. variicola]